jgi:hypothetical protein
LASTRLPRFQDDLTNNFEQSWDRCFAILGHYEKQIKTAPRAAEVLRTLRQQTEYQAQDTGEWWCLEAESLPLFLSLADKIQKPVAATLEQTYDFDTYQSQGGDISFDTWFGQHLVDFDSIFQAG